MSTTLTICVLGVLCVSLLAALLYREHRHDAERAELLDRIAAPQAVAFQHLAGNVPAAVDNTDEEDDKRHGADLPFDEDLSLIGISADEREIY